MIKGGHPLFNYNERMTELEIINFAKKLEGKHLKDIASVEDLAFWLSNSKNKGSIGNAIQACYFGIPANSKKDADFHHHNLELKVTPVKQKKNSTLSSKERLSLTMISYKSDYKYSFENSHLFEKCNHMLLIFYLYDETVPIEEFKILQAEKFTIPMEDLPQIKADYEKIMETIRKGEAHLLSESQTTYLAASTKGAGGEKDLINQPFSQELAKRRGFSFKPKYIGAYFNSMYKPWAFEKLTLETNQTLEEFLNQKLLPFNNLSILEIQNKLGYLPYKGIKDDKAYLPRLVSKIFNIENTNLDDVEQFQKGNIKFKTYRIRKEKSSNQDISFRNINFDEILNVPFDESSWYEMLGETKYLFVVFEETGEGNFLKRHILWNAPPELILALETLYNQIKYMLQNNEVEVKITYNSKGTEVWKNNLPKKKFVPYFQIRSKGNKESSFTTLPNGMKFKKQCLFLNKEYFYSLL